MKHKIEIVKYPDVVRLTLSFRFMWLWFKLVSTDITRQRNGGISSMADVIINTWQEHYKIPEAMVFTKEGNYPTVRLK